MSTNQPFRSRRFRVFGLLLVGILAVAGISAAQESGTRDRIYVVTHIDTLPASGPAAGKILQQYAADSRKDKGAVRIELYVQISRLNHFTMVEVWENQQAYDAHLAAAHTKQFREQIQHFLGSPFDERLHQIVE